MFGVGIDSGLYAARGVGAFSLPFGERSPQAGLAAGEGAAPGPPPHKRSNVESTFSMIKAKFRDHVRSKTDVAMVNEVLCKIVCHNICCLIQESHELGIDAAFWSGAPRH